MCDKCETNLQKAIAGLAPKINGDPKLIGRLYDLALMPEQIRTVVDFHRMECIVNQYFSLLELRRVNMFFNSGTITGRLRKKKWWQFWKKDFMETLYEAAQREWNK